MDRETASPCIRVMPPGPNALKWAAFHQRHASHSTYFYDFVWDRSMPAIGPFCTDVDGNVILDFVSHVASSPLGYNHPALVQLSMSLARIDPDRYAGTDFVGGFGPDPESCPVPTPSHLHHKLVEITRPFGFDTAFLCNSGAEAVENAIKVCYHHRKNFGYGFCFTGAFHGRTLGALSLNRSKRAHRNWFPTIPRIVELPFCRCRGPCECGWLVTTIRRKGRMSRLAQILDPEIGIVDPHEVAYIIIEPILGEGGYDLPASGFISEVGKIARENNIPFICDEIQTGLGRTGRWWASEHFDIFPDLIVAAKALRVGATLGRREMFPEEPMRISSTWGEGNAIASAVGYRTIEIIEKEDLLRNAREMGAYFLEGLSALQERHPIIFDPSGLGLMLGFSVESEQWRNRILRLAFQKGLLLLGCGFETVRILPPLDVRKREIDLALNILDGVLAEVTP
ncbi:MAG: aminotransferase class III-fold pyridoxal phosphate-dependent enzyme [Thermodesulfobacteriota bacterium]